MENVRSLETINAALNVAQDAIFDMKAYMQELRDMRDDYYDEFVVGFDFGMFVPRVYAPMLCGIQHAKRFGSRLEAHDYVVTNRKGERARIMPWGAAVDMCIELQAEALYHYRECALALYDEREEAERLERAADEAVFYDQFENNWTAQLKASIENAAKAERARKGGK